MLGTSTSDHIVKITPEGRQSVTAIGGLQVGPIAADGLGNIYVGSPNRIVKIAPDGTQMTVTDGVVVDENSHLAVDNAGNVYISGQYVSGQQTAVVLEISPKGQRTTVGSRLGYPTFVSVDNSGNVYIYDQDPGMRSLSRVVKVAPDGTQSTWANVPYWTVDNMGVDNSGNVYLEAEKLDGVVVRISPRGTQTAVAVALGGMVGIAVDNEGTVYIANDFSPLAVLKVPATGLAQIIHGPCGAGAVAVDNQRNVYLAGSSDGTPCVVTTTPSGKQTVLATGLVGRCRPMRGSCLLGESPYGIHGIAVDKKGDVYIADTGDNRVVKVTPTGGHTTVGSGLKAPNGVAVDGQNNVYISDTGHNRVVKVAPNGAQKTLVSDVSQPLGVAVATNGIVYIADYGHNRIVKVAPDGTESSL